MISVGGPEGFQVLYVSRDECTTAFEISNGRGGGFGRIGRSLKIDPDPDSQPQDTIRTKTGLYQDAADLASLNQHIIGPFELSQGLSHGAIGQFSHRVFWRRLGMTLKLRDRVYEVSGTDPVKIAIMGAELQVSGTNG
jgi:hypothetical protein